MKSTHLVTGGRDHCEGYASEKELQMIILPYCVDQFIKTKEVKNVGSVLLCICNSGISFLCAQQFTGWIYINQPPFLCIWEVERRLLFDSDFDRKTPSKSNLCPWGTLLYWFRNFFPYWDFSRIFPIIIYIYQELREEQRRCDGRGGGRAAPHFAC